MPSNLAFRSGAVNFELTAYLIEATSVGGFSGSPVFFLHRTDVVDEPTGAVTATAAATGFLDLVTGHFPSDSGNSGIAVVTPAHAIRELLLRSDVVEERDTVAMSAAETLGLLPSLPSNV